MLHRVCGKEIVQATVVRLGCVSDGVSKMAKAAMAEATFPLAGCTRVDSLRTWPTCGYIVGI